jgi:adenylate cyclase
MRAPRLPLHWLLGAAALIACGFLPVVQGLDLRATDVLLSTHAPHPDIVIVAIDNKSLQEIGRWPWSRSVHADFFRSLAALHPRAVGVDVMWSESESPEADGALAQALAAADFPVILPAEEIQRSGENVSSTLRPLESLRTAENVSLGHVVIPPSADGFSRLFPRMLMSQDGVFPPFGSQIARQLGATPPSEANAVIDFAGPAGSFPTVSYSDVLKGRADKNALEGKILLMGASASDLHDTVRTPFGVMAGIEWQANVLDNALLHPPLALWPRWLIVLTAAVMMCIMFAALRLCSHRFSFAIAAAGLLVPPLVSIGVWETGGVLPYLYADVLVLCAFLGQAFERWYKAERDRRALRTSLQSYLSPLVLEQMLKDPSLLRLGGYRREITAFFSDIRGFTSISESTDPDVLANLLYEYFTAMTDEVFATDGVVCQFAGDGMYCFWGAPVDQPDHSLRAVRSGIRMMKKLEELRVSWKERGLPFIDIGIGINNGLATVGNLGSAKRFDFTAIGDCVNTASRLESLNKEHKTHMLVSQSVQQRLGADIKTRLVGEVLVKGKNVPLRVFEVTDENWR